MADIAAVVIQTLQWVGAPVTRQFQYLCCFTRNITSLRNEANQLEGTTQDLQRKVDTAKNDLRVISPGVEIWLQNSNDIENETRGILDEVSNVESGCFKLGARFFLSRRAKKTTDRVKELRGRSNFQADDISQPAPPPATKAVPLAKTYNFDSRKKIEEDIMTTLRGEDVKMVGISGMGGLGKTTMAKRIMNRALEEHMFEEVVMAVVSRPIDKLKIQLEIGGSLGLKLDDETSQAARVQKLHARLSGPKRILLVLDDVWERFQPEDLGIPCDCKGCTILVTSRNRDVLSAMNVEKIFGMEVLSKEDSWLLFRMGAGQCVDDTKLNSIAKEVVSECAGLPIALITVGAALKGEVDVSIWKNALQRLKINCTPDIPEYIKQVYNPLKLSYDVLERKYQDVFLLCCLYPEDAHIPLERLTYFCMGLRLLEGAIGNVEAARNRIRALTKVLKSRSLLLDSYWGDDYVRMHDVVRDVCIYIANKQEGYIGDNDLTSSLQRYKLHSGFELLQIRNSRDKEITFDGISDLYVLSIESCSQLTSLPFTQMLRNLYTLILNWCPRVDTLSVVGELAKLEILICRGCDSIEELPPEIKRLNRLKVLNLTWCKNLQRIGRGIVSSLVGLEELRMLGSFKKWEAEDRKERENAGLRELGELTKLRCLEIEIEDLALAAENIRLSSKVDRFTITFLYQIKDRVRPFGSESNRLMGFEKYLSNKKMCLKWEGATCLGDWIKMLLLRDTECLLLVGNGANEVGSLITLEKIRYLELGECESMKKVVTSSMDKGGATVFPSIENLLLFKLPKLEEICDDRISSNSFQNLRELKLDDLPVLKQLWMSSQNDLEKDFLPQLEVLYIENCGMMETVFLWKGEDGNENTSCHHITKRFPKLKELVLYKLPNLISLCQGIEGIEFPLLKRIRISGCGKMKGMVWNEKISGGSSNNASIHALFCPQEDFLPQLEVLEIKSYEMMEAVFLWKGEEANENNSCHHTTKIFPKLKELQLHNLPNLISLCQGIEGIEFPLLKRIRISGCGKMKGMVWNEKISGGSSNNASIHALFCPQQVSFELEELRIFGCKSSQSLFTSSMVGNLVNLKELSIEWCDEMVEVIKDDEEKGMSGGGQRTLLFPKLQTLMLLDLPKLVRFCESKGIESIQFPVLREIRITGCGKMKGMVANENNSGGSSTNAAGTLHLFCQSKQVSFSELEKLIIGGCQGILSLFTSSMAGNLVNLKELDIGYCDEMVEVIKDDEEKGMSGAQRTTILFPKLQQLCLLYLPSLVRFCEWKCDVELPSLTEVLINHCHNMKSLTLGPLNTPKLERVNIHWKIFGGVKDLNGLVQQQYLRRAEETTDVATQKEAPAAAAK